MEPAPVQLMCSAHPPVTRFRWSSSSRQRKWHLASTACEHQLIESRPWHGAHCCFLTLHPVTVLCFSTEADGALLPATGGTAACNRCTVGGCNQLLVTIAGIPRASLKKMPCTEPLSPCVELVELLPWLLFIV
jgi:hypothetical protein